MALIQAHITKVEKQIDSEWGAIHTDHDTVKKLTTKRQDLLREAAGFKTAGVLVGIDYTERTRHDPTSDRTYRNFYYDKGAALGNGASAADMGIDIVPSTRGEDPDRSWRICMQTGGKLAVATLPLMPVDQRDFETQKTIATAWAEFFFFTPKPTQPSGITRPLSSERGYGYEPFGGDPVGSIEQPPVEDDIPF